MKFRFLYLLILFVFLSLPAIGRAQDTVSSDDDIDLQRRVAFDFNNRDIAEVIQHVVWLTGWPVFYDPAQVPGKVTIVTPGKIPLEQAIRLLQGAMRSHAHVIQVLLPNRPQPVPLSAVLAEVYASSQPRDVIVWRNSNALGPQSRPYTCAPSDSGYSLLPYWIDVIVDEKQYQHPRRHR